MEKSFLWRKGHLTALAGHFKECKVAKDATQGRVSLIEKERDELIESVSFLMHRVKKLLVPKESFDANVVTLGVERYALKESLPTRDSELEGLPVTVVAK